MLKLCILGIKMTTEKRIKIITESEVQELYSPPPFIVNDQRFFFALDDREQEACKNVRQRRSRCMLTLLLGYFKAKPVILIPRYHQVKADLKYISQNIIPGPGFTPFTLTQKEKDRLYSRIFELTAIKTGLPTRTFYHGTGAIVPMIVSANEFVLDYIIQFLMILIHLHWK